MALPTSSILLVLFSAQLSFGAAEFLPPIDQLSNTEAAQVHMIQNLLPWSQYNKSEMIRLQHQGLAILKQNFPDFEKWAQAKPDPITINISKKSTSQELSYVLRDEYFIELNRAVLEKLQDLLSKINPTTTIDLVSKNLRDQAYESLGTHLLNGAESIPGLITGILQVVDPQKRLEIFKAGEPSVQVQMIRDLKLTEEQFKNGGFQPSRFNLPSNISLREILHLLDSKINSHRELLVDFGLLTLIDRLSIDIQDQMMRGQIPDEVKTLLKNSDFNFLEKAESSTSIKLEFELNERFPQDAAKMAKLLSQITKTFPKQWFQKRVVPVEIESSYLKLVEVHPYLAVYRGCIGGDCSTTRSPMYPFSPWEHDFYIMTPQNEFLGYISATRVTTDGQPAFYLKDITGRKLSAEQAEAIVYAFSKVYRYYGSSQLLLAGSKFTNEQNHYEVLKDLLSIFNGGKENQSGPEVKLVPVDFPDKEIRNLIRNDSRFFSGYDYDSPSTHAKGAVFVSRRDFFKDHQVSFHKETLSAAPSKAPKQSLLLALRMLFADSNAKISELPGVDERAIRNIFSILKNQSGHPTENYYSEVAAQLQKYDIELTKAFRLEYETFFLEGHLVARDAFSTKNLAESEKYLVAYCRRVKNFLKIDRIVGTGQNELSQSSKFSEFIRMLNARAELQDVAMISLFASYKIPAALAALRDPRISSKLERMIKEFVFGNEIPRFEKEHVGSGLLKMKSLSDFTESPYGTSYDTILRAYHQTFEELGLNFSQIQDAELKKIFEMGLAVPPGAANAPEYLARLNILTNEFTGKNIPADLYYTSILQFSQTNPDAFRASGFLENRYAFLKTASGEDTQAAVEALLLQGLSPKISKLIQSKKFSRAYVNMISEYILIGKLANNPYAITFIENSTGIRFFSQLKEISRNFHSFYNSEAHMEKILKLIGLSFQDILIIPPFREAYIQSILNSGNSYSVNPNDQNSLKQYAKILKYWHETILNGNLNWVVYPALYTRDFQSNVEYLKAYEKIVRAANNGSTSAATALTTMLSNSIAIDFRHVDERLLREWSNFDNLHVLNFSNAELIRRHKNFEITDKNILAQANFVLNYAGYANYKTNDSFEVQSLKNAVEVLLKYTSKNPNTRQTIVGYFSYLLDNPQNPKFAFKCSLIYLANGGKLTPELRERMQFQLSQISEDLRSTSEGQRLLAMYRTLTMTSTSQKPLMCRTLFRN